MVTITIIACLACCVISVWSDSTGGSDKALLQWVPPEDISQHFPYYLSGYDKDNRPIWVIETGKFNYRWVTQGGLDRMNNVDKFMAQCFERVKESAKEKHGTEYAIILDFDGFKFSNFGNYKTVKYLEVIIRKNLQLDANHIVAVNVDPITETFINLFRKLSPDVLGKMQIVIKSQLDWKEELRKLFPEDQLPEWYGGRPGHKPIEIYG